MAFFNRTGIIAYQEVRALELLAGEPSLAQEYRKILIKKYQTELPSFSPKEIDFILQGKLSEALAFKIKNFKDKIGKLYEALRGLILEWPAETGSAANLENLAKWAYIFDFQTFNNVLNVLAEFMFTEAAKSAGLTFTDQEITAINQLNYALNLLVDRSETYAKDLTVFIPKSTSRPVLALSIGTLEKILRNPSISARSTERKSWAPTFWITPPDSKTSEKEASASSSTATSRTPSR